MQSLEIKKNKLAADNYYKTDNDMRQDIIDNVFSGYRYELFQTTGYDCFAELIVDGTDYKYERPVLNFIEMGNNLLNGIPDNVIRTYNAYEKDMFLCGRLPTAENEICISFNTYINIKSSNFVSISHNEILGKTLSICFPDEQHSVLYVKVVGVLDFALSDIFEKNVIYKVDGIDNTAFTAVKKINRVYIADFSYISEINEIISNNNLESEITYAGSSRGVYLEFKHFGELASTVFYLIAVPLAVVLVFVCFMMLNNFFKVQSRLFVEMLLVGYTPGKILRFTFFELLFCSMISLLFSAVFGILFVILIKHIFSSMFIGIELSIGTVICSIAVLIVMFLLFIGVSLLISKRHMKPNIYSLTK